MRFASNLELSLQRSVAVAAILQRAGLAPERLGVAGCGEHKPVASNRTEKGRARNRRIEVILLPKADEVLPLPDEMIGGDGPARAGAGQPLR